MKKLISGLLAMVMVLSISCTTAFAIETVTLSITDDVTTVKAGDIIEAVVKADTTRYMVNYAITVQYDKNVFELLNSATYEDFANNEDNKAILEEILLEDPSYTMEAFYGSEKYGLTPIMSDTMVDFWISNNAKIPGTLATQMSGAGYPIFLSSGLLEPVSITKRVTNAPLAAVRLKVKEGVSAGTTSISIINGNAAAGTTKDTVADVPLTTDPVTLTVEGASQPTNATVTIETPANAVLKVTDSTGAAVATGASVAAGSVLTVSAKPKAGYELTAQTGIDNTILGMGGTYNVTVNADTTISVTATEVTAKPVTVAAAYIDAATKTNIVFGKADTTGEYGIKLEDGNGGYTIPEGATFAGTSTYFAANNASEKGYFAINFHALPAATYTATAYQGAEGSRVEAEYGYTFAVAE